MKGIKSCAFNKIKHCFTFLFFVICLLSPLHAEEKKSDSVWPNKIKIGGEFRLRNEDQINYDFNNNSSAQTDAFLLLRTRVYLDLNPADFIQLFAM